MKKIFAFLTFGGTISLFWTLIFDALVSYINKLSKNQNHPNIEKLRMIQRDAQFYLDFVEAENSSGFHAPQEAARILMKSMNLVLEGEVLIKQ